MPKKKADTRKLKRKVKGKYLVGMTSLRKGTRQEKKKNPKLSTKQARIKAERKLKSNPRAYD